MYQIKRKIINRVIAAALCAGLFIITNIFTPVVEPVAAQTPATAGDDVTYAPRGADTCLTCHRNPAVTPILSSVHGNRANPLTPFANHDCESCHGASPTHYQAMQSPAVVFGNGGGRFPASDVATQNGMCLSCHESGQRLHWASSEHQFADLSCATCHKVHQSQSAVPAGLESTKLCLSCHLEKRAQIAQRSHHPLNEGLMTCTDCHNPHGSDTVALLAKSSVNETCIECHTEKRGPLLWEHEPVTDDCTNCHNPHGSTQSRLLTARLPFLCQTCHSDAFHPSSLYTGRDTPPTGAGQAVLGSSCTNCHSQIHGSNHPSGSRFTR